MADKKFGQKRVCPQCEKKFYDLNKKSPFKCPCGEKDIVIEEDVFANFNTQPVQEAPKPQTKDEFADIDNADDAVDDDDGVISLDDAASEEEQNSKN